MPENLRGVGCGKSFQEKNLNAYGPKTDGKAPVLGGDGKPESGGDLSKCTYIDLVGSYWYSYVALLRLPRVLSLSVIVCIWAAIW